MLLLAEYTFMGSLIIREVIKDLIPKGIKQAKVVMLSGTRLVFFLHLFFVAQLLDKSLNPLYHLNHLDAYIT